MRAHRSLPLVVALAAALALGACADDDPTTDDTGDGVAQPDGSEASDGPLPMEPQDADAGEGPPMDDGGEEPPPPGLDTDGAPESPEAFARVEEARRQWAALGVTSYEMVLDRVCFCPTSGVMQVTVEDGVVTAASFVDPARADEEIPLEFAPTIDQLLENAAATARAFEDVTVEITVEDGVPVQGNADAPMVADEEVVWTVQEFDAM